MYNSPTTALYGFTTLPADQSKTSPSFSSTNESPAFIDVATIQLPTTPLAQRVLAYSKEKLSPQTINHSLRVYSYGMAIAREGFPEWGLDEKEKLKETWFLTAMLHDIGTGEKELGGTRLSFEFWGGMHALQLLQDGAITKGCGHEHAAAPREQAESVCEAIIRHQDVQEKGNVTLMTRLIHLGTLLDNIGAGAELVSKKTVESVNAKYDRKEWGGCFESVVRREKEIKPYGESIPVGVAGVCVALTFDSYGESD